jgi:predicted DCC family thiol-disulfide oxidoreductase YuxK
MSDGELQIIYDGECPFCASYVRMTRLKTEVGPVRLIDARSGAPEVAAVVALGHDLDTGMIVRHGGEIFHGEAAMRHLAILTAPEGLFNGAMRRVFRSPRRAALLYPVLLRGRRLALRLLGRRTIAETSRLRDQQE